VESPDPYPAAPQLRLDDLLTELQARLQTVLATRDRVSALLEAVVAVSTNLDLETVLKQSVEAAITLVRARYGALGVIGEGGRLVGFVPVGVTEQQIAAMGYTTRRRGLANLAERAAALGGELVVAPADGGGTQLKWRVPVR
jgi:two-component system, NarL family, sensor histidine kinase DevS